MRTSSRRIRRRDQAGYAAIVTALLASTVFLGMAALGVDTARWYVELERVQKAADAAALAGVTWMPNDFADAQAAALASAKANGYDDASSTVNVLVQVGDRPSELKVTVSSRVQNTFGAGIGVPQSWMTRSATADYTAPAPMGSPCNTFGNEPPSQPAPAAQPAGSALPTPPFSNCSSSPAFWAAIEGPSTDKVQGDRFMNYTCASTSTYACASGKNTEYRPEGYFWSVHVEPAAVNTAITVQVYDPAYIYTGIDCTNDAWDRSIPGPPLSAPQGSGAYSAYMNDYAQNDGNNRYSATEWYTSNYGATSTNSNATQYCNGDYIPGSSTVSPPVTSFAMRSPNDTDNPKIAPVMSQCTKQFVGLSAPPTPTQLSQYTDAAKTTKNGSYNLQMAQLYHQWYPLCTFTPTAPGDYYLQVRTNVSAGGTAVANVNPKGTTNTSLIYTGNSAVTAADGNTTAGVGLNSFAIRAVPADSTKKSYIAVAGHESMPILQNKKGTTATFNLIRALPGTKGQYIAFDFFDPADGAGSSGATVTILPPTEATGSVKSGSGGTPPGCQASLDDGAYSAAAGCAVKVYPTTHNGQLEHMVIPIPSDYVCGHTPLQLGDCWFSVKISFPDTVTDFTTWTANIGGDPVRLIK